MILSAKKSKLELSFIVSVLLGQYLMFFFYEFDGEKMIVLYLHDLERIFKRNYSKKKGFEWLHTVIVLYLVLYLVSLFYLKAKNRIIETE